MASKIVKQFISIILIQCMVLQAMSLVINDTSIIEKHEQWMASYGRQYDDAAEKEKRYKIFKANVEYIDLVNRADNKPYKLSINQFADLTNEEFKAAHIGHRSLFKETSTIKSSFVSDKSVNPTHPSIDWRANGAVTPIREVSCGAWTIPAVDTVEALIKIETGKLYTLSNQEIVDCSNGGIDCYQGSTEDAFEFIKQHGLTTESNYPPKGSKGTCDTKKEKEPVAKINGYKYVPANNENALLQVVANQPVAVMVDASGSDFQFYAGGVFTGDCGTNIDHGVTLVGYGTSNNMLLKYWRIKNSWGKSWGEDGYMRMRRDISAKEGLCGIAIEPIYPTL